MDIRDVGKYVSDISEKLNIKNYLDAVRNEFSGLLNGGDSRGKYLTRIDDGDPYTYGPSISRWYQAAASAAGGPYVTNDCANLSNILSNISNNMTSAAVPESEPNLATWRILAVVFLTLSPLILIYLWDLRDQWKIDETEEEETFFDTGELTEGMTRDGEFPKSWRY